MAKNNIRAVEIHDPRRRRGGSGCLITEDLILSANHVVAAAAVNLGESVFDVRLYLEFERDGVDAWRDGGAELCWSDAELDLAVLRLLEPIRLAEVATLRTAPLDLSRRSAYAPGFPLVQRAGAVQNPESVEGRVSRFNAAKSGQFRMDVTSPIPDDAAQWTGMSGAAVFADDALVGIITQTNKTFQEKSLWGTPITRALEEPSFRKLLLESGERGHALLTPIELNGKAPVARQWRGRVPRLPTPFVSRPWEVDAILRALEAPGAVVCVCGGPGTGKSVLAAEVVGHPAVRSRYNEGVLWAVLGEEPDLLAQYVAWLAELGEETSKAASCPTARAMLEAALAERACVLVIDDAWEAAAPRALVAHGGRGCAIVTTRLKAVCVAVQPTDTFEIAEMTPTQAWDLLSLETDDEQEAEAGRELIDSLGQLPLAIDLARAAIADGATAVELRDEVKREIVQLDMLDAPDADEVADPDVRKRLSLTNSVALSLKRLDAPNRRAFTLLGLLHDDAIFSAATLGQIWPQPLNARKTARYLQRKSLLRQLDGGHFQLHDVLHAAARKLITAPEAGSSVYGVPGLGMDLVAAHRELLTRYRHGRAGWRELPDDGYIHEHLFWHLEKSGQVDAVFDVLAEESEAGGNGWFEAREHLGQLGGYIADVTRALEFGLEGTDGAAAPDDAAVVASLSLLGAARSIASGLPGIVLARLFSRGLWPLARAENYALQIPETAERLAAIGALAVAVSEQADHDAMLHLFHLGASLLKSREAVSGAADFIAAAGAAHPAGAAEIAMTLDAELDDRSHALAACLPHLNPDDRDAMVAHTLITVFQGAEAFQQSRLDRVSPWLTDETLARAVESCRDMKIEAYRAGCLAALLPRVLEVWDVDRALTLVDSIEDRVVRAEAWAVLLERLEPARREKSLAEVLTTWHEVSDEDWRDAQDALARESLGEGMATLLAVTFAGYSWRLDVLTELAAFLAPDQLEPIATELRNEDHLVTAARGFGVLKDHLEPIVAGAWRDELLARIRPLLKDRHHDQAATAAAHLVLAGVADEALRAMLLDCCAKVAFGRETVLAAVATYAASDELLAVLMSVRSESYRTINWSEFQLLLDKLNDGHLLVLIDVLRQTCDAQIHAVAEASLARFATEPRQREALQAVRAIDNEFDRLRALKELLPGLSPDRHAEVAELGDALQNDEAFAEYFAPAIALWRGEKAARDVLDRAVDRALLIQDRQRMGWTFSELVPHLSREQWSVAARSLLRIGPRRDDEDVSRWGEGYAIGCLLDAELVDDQLVDSLGKRLLDLVETIDDSSDRADLVCQSARHLSAEQLDWTLVLVGGCRDLYDRLRAETEILWLRKPLDVDVYQSILDRVVDVGEKGFSSARERQEEIVTRLIVPAAPTAPRLQLEAITTDYIQRKFVLAMAECKDQSGLRKHFEELWDFANGIGDLDDRARSVVALSEQAVEKEKHARLRDAWRVVLRSPRDDTRAELCARLLKQFDEQPDTDWRSLWSEAVPYLKVHKRNELVSDLGALAPLLHELGGQALVEVAIETLRRARRWFP